MFGGMIRTPRRMQQRGSQVKLEREKGKEKKPGLDDVGLGEMLEGTLWWYRRLKW